MEMLAEILETGMILCFGISWPLSVYRSYKSRSTKGKSLMFVCFIALGYVCGIISKIVGHVVLDKPLGLAFWFYFPNITLVCTDICLYFRNKKIEAAEEKKAA